MAVSSILLHAFQTCNITCSLGIPILHLFKYRSSVLQAMFCSQLCFNFPPCHDMPVLVGLLFYYPQSLGVHFRVTLCALKIQTAFQLLGVYKCAFQGFQCCLPVGHYSDLLFIVGSLYHNNANRWLTDYPRLTLMHS